MEPIRVHQAKTRIEATEFDLEDSRFTKGSMRNSRLENIMLSGTVINDVFEHASIPATITEFFIGQYDARSPREIAANTFLNALSLPTMRADSDCPTFTND